MILALDTGATANRFVIMMRLRRFRGWALAALAVAIVPLVGAQESSQQRPVAPASSQGAADFLLFEAFGDTFHDAEKRLGNTGDDLLCWAAAASNVLAWTGWGIDAGFRDEDEIFRYFQDHWTDHRHGSPRRSWHWWFTGIDPQPEGARVTQPGGGFWKAVGFPSHTWENRQGDLFRGIGSKMIAREPLALRDVLRDGYGVAIQLVKPLEAGKRKSHVITLWGYRATTQEPFAGVFVTDSDDDKRVEQGVEPENRLAYYAVSFREGKWWFENYRNEPWQWHIIAAYALASKATSPPPTP